VAGVAFLAKYLVAIYFPFVCLYVMARFGCVLRGAAREVAWFVVPLSVLCAGYGLIFLAPLINLLSSSLH
jgi:hypothetical protein